MKINFLFMSLMALTLSSCQAQAHLITVSGTQKGNTGQRGIIPQEENYKPVEGKDYYDLTLTINKDCTLEIAHLTIKKDDVQMKFMPKFEDGSTKKRFKKGETAYLHVEKEKDMKIEKPSITSEGILSLKINNRFLKIPIKEFTMIMRM